MEQPIKSADRDSGSGLFISGMSLLLSLFALAVVFFATPGLHWIFALTWIVLFAGCIIGLVRAGRRITYTLTDRDLSVSTGTGVELTSIRHIEVQPGAPYGGGFALYHSGVLLLDTASGETLRIGPINDPDGWAEAIRDAATTRGGKPTVRLLSGLAAPDLPPT